MGQPHRLGPVHLIVHDLDLMENFYQEGLGFTVHWREGKRAGLGAGGSEDLLVLEEDRAAQRHKEATDIYHFAIYMPDRFTFARTVARLFSLRWRNSPTDHLVSEATYLEDPEGNTVELTFETPDRGHLVFPEDGTRPYALGKDGHRQGVTEALDPQQLFALLPDDIELSEPLPPETKVHHVHLYAQSMPAMDQFYREVLGFRKSGYSETIRMADYGPADYPVHMLAFNTWKGEGVPLKPKGSAGLKYFTVVVPDVEAVVVRAQANGSPLEKVGDGYLLYDPSGLGVLVQG
jgi:catechol 2,3-dioxygenase